MAVRSLVSGLALGLVQPCLASIGLTGIDSYPNMPFCAHACYSSLASYRLDCSEIHGDPNDHHAHVVTTADCRHDNYDFLTSVAWCLSTKCAEYDDLSVGDIEKFWEETVTSDPAVQPVWSYSLALANITEDPTVVLGHGGTINTTVVTPEFWNVLYGTYSTLYQEGWNMNVFGLIILNVGFALPIVLTWIGYLPVIDRIYEKLRPYIVYPSLIGTYNVRPLPFHLGNAPTVGQALYIAVMIILNIVLSAVNFKTTEAHLWFQNKGQQITGYLMYRTGVLSFAMAPLVVLFSGRNNFLQWITNWQHSTFILLHRWIARLFVLQALLHTLLAVGVYSQMGIYDIEAKLAYWAWGVVATLFACIMVVVSTSYFRSLSYEIFLVSHIIMAVIVIVGSWYHIVERFTALDGFTMWLWTASAVWFFDRLVRVIRIAKVGSRHATVTEIGDGYVRVDIPDVRWDAAPGNKAYVYFPSLSPLRPWENHPFSPVPFSFLAPTTSTAASASASGGDVSENGEVEQQREEQDVEKRPISVGLVASARRPERSVSTAGISLFVRKSKGMTGSLQSHNSLYTLLEGPYPNTLSSSILKCDRVLLFAGGIGITGVLPWTRAHHNVRLAWTAKESAECLVTALSPSMASLADKDIKLGTRTDIKAVLHEEIHAGWARIGVVACGPGGLCDDVRAIVVKAAKNHLTVFELQVDAYSW